MNKVLVGKVKWFDDGKGYGFIVSDGSDYFVHWKEIQQEGHKSLEKNNIVEFTPGEFPINYKPEDFAERRIQSMPRNRKILDVLYRSKNVEVQGSGIRKVLELCAANNVKYEYYNNEFGFRFSFYRNNVTVNVTKDVTSDVTKETPKRVNELDGEVMLLLKENPVYTREEIAQKVGKTARTVQRSLDRLKEAKKIVRIGNKVSGYWEVID